MLKNILGGKFERKILNSIKYVKKRIVYMDGNDNRIIEGIKIFQSFNDSELILVGNKNEIFKKIKEVEINNIDNIDIIDPINAKNRDAYKKILVDNFREKEISFEEQEVENMVKSSTYFSALMVKNKDADCGIGGSSISSGLVIKALIRVIGKGKEGRYLNGAMLEIVPDCKNGLNKMYLLADVAVIPDPDKKQLLDIVLLTYETAISLFEEEPKIAMLSYSTKGSSKGKSIEKILEAVEKVKRINPDMNIDGELQFDAAIIPEVAKVKAPGSKIAGKANVLIFPNLDAANICCKAIQRLAKARAYGSIIQGLDIPFNDLSRGCSAEDVAILTAITLLQLENKTASR